MKKTVLMLVAVAAMACSHNKPDCGWDPKDPDNFWSAAAVMDAGGNWCRPSLYFCDDKGHCECANREDHDRHP